MTTPTLVVLAIDTATRYAGVALLSQGRVARSVAWHSSNNHTRELLPAIESVLGAAGASLASVDGLALSQGPGGFSALRVGFSIVKAFALAWGMPVAAVSTLEAEALPYRAAGAPTVAILDAGRGEVHWRCFDWPDQGASEQARLTPVRVLAEALPPGAVVCGEGVESHGDALAEMAGGALRLARPYVPGARVVGVALLGADRLARGLADDPGTLQPLYVRHPSVGTPRR